MGWQPGADGWTGGEPSPGLPGGREDPGSSAPERDRRLAGFTDGGEWDACAPSAALAAALDGASGPEWRCPGADRDEMVGLLRKWQSMEAWATAGKLGVLRALLREDDLELPGTPRHGDLPDEWSQSLTYEVAAALSMPTPSADKLISLAWSLQARLPGIGALLVEGRLTYAKAKAVDEALRLLSDEDAAAAEAMILPQLPGKTYGQVEKLAAAAAVTVDPESATGRREDAEQHRSRVTMFREQSGAAGLSGRDLPTDQTLAAHARVCARAQEYKDSGVFPGTRMDQFRAAAYLDLLNGISAADRIASGELATGTHTGEDTDPADAWARGLDADGCDCSCAECDGGCLPPEDGDHGDDEPGPEDEGPNDEGPEGGPGNGGSPDSPRGPAQHDERPSRPGIPPRLTDLVIPLATLLGLSERPGEGHGLGVLDPSLCRDLAIRAAASPDSTLCVTVVDPDGIAIGHGCARGNRNEEASLTALPSRVNLTVTPALLTELAGCDPPGPPGPAGDPPWCRPWTFTLPGGAEIIVRLEPLPTFECDHRYESHGYQPSDKLRHLVQIRDYECTFPPCSRHARESDFEHALPYHKGGKTCGCNAGARSRQCHQVKQSPGWNVTQPRPGWHRWEAPSGRIYIQEAHRYSLLQLKRAADAYQHHGGPRPQRQYAALDLDLRRPVLARLSRGRRVRAEGGEVTVAAGGGIGVEDTRADAVDPLA